MPRAYYKSYPGISALGRDLRSNQSPFEIRLWNILRRKNLSGYKFLRQHPIFYHVNKNWVDFYIADFYCSKLKLIIELDGKIHDNRKEYDNERDSKLLNKGILVVRIKNEEINDIKKIRITLNAIINKRIKELTEKHPPSLIV
jgi:leucyl-tRNA synthetase